MKPVVTSSTKALFYDKFTMTTVDPNMILEAFILVLHPSFYFKRLFHPRDLNSSIIQIPCLF